MLLFLLIERFNVEMCEVVSLFAGDFHDVIVFVYVSSVRFILVDSFEAEFI